MISPRRAWSIYSSRGRGEAEPIAAERSMESARQAYKAYSPRPFAREERDRVEILFGGLHWRAERVIQAVFENLGYRARPLPAATKSDLLLGRELPVVGQARPQSL